MLRAVRQLYEALSAAYDVECPTVTHSGAWEGDSGSSCYRPGTHAITLQGQMSIITTLHEYMHARGYGESAAVWWSINAFRMHWPRSFARLGPATPGTHFMALQFPDRTPEQAEAEWRIFYAARASVAEERQRAAIARRAVRRVQPRRRGRRLTSREERTRALAGRTEALEAQARDAMRAEAQRAEDRLASEAQDIGVLRFQNLDLDDEPETTPPVEDEDEDDAGVARFRTLDLGDDDDDLPTVGEVQSRARARRRRSARNVRRGRNYPAELGTPEAECSCACHGDDTDVDQPCTCPAQGYCNPGRRAQNPASRKCICCNKRPATVAVRGGAAWCATCLRQAERENAAMCRAVGGSK
jgi:hypothetical protein